MRDLVRRREAEVVDLFHPFIGDDTVLVDLGSGWGRISTLLKYKFPQLSVISAEISKAGRLCTEHISDQFGLGISPIEFNYLDWSVLFDHLKKRHAKNLVFFSNHSAEQVPYLNIQMFEDFLRLDGKIKFIHIEPVGWQMSGDAEVVKYSQAPERGLGERGGYNKNLLLIIQELRRRGLVEIDRMIPNYLAFETIRNSGSLIIHHCRR